MLCHTKYVNTLPPCSRSYIYIDHSILYNIVLIFAGSNFYTHTSKVKEAHTVAMSIDVKNNEGLLTLGVRVIISLNWSCGSLCT